MSFGIPSTPPASTSYAGPEPGAVNDALKTLDALKSLAQTKAFSEWYVTRVNERVAELTNAILDNESLSADQVMAARIQRRECKRLLTLLKDEQSKALHVLADRQKAEAAAKQVKDTSPPMTEMPSQGFDFAAKAAPEVSVGGLMKEFGEMWSLFGNPPTK